jgi:hypothetical protein
MAIPQVIVVALNTTLVGLEAVTRSGAEVAGTEPPAALVTGAQMGFAFGMVIMFFSYFTLYAVALGATTYAISEVHLGRLPTVRGAYRSIRGRAGRLFLLILGVLFRVLGIFILFIVGVGAIGAGAGALGGAGLGPLLAIVFIIFSLLGMLAAAVVAVLMLLRYGVAVPALLLENLRPKEAIRRSIQLTQGNLGRVFLIVFLMSMVSWTVAMMCQGPFLAATMILAVKGQGAAPLWLQVISNVAGGVGQAVTGPLLMIGLSLLYYDTRVRKEGLDLQLIMDALEPRPTPPAQP